MTLLTAKKNKILILALSGIGDALMFTPAIKELRRIYPDSLIDAVVMYGGVRDIYSRLGYLDNIYHFNFINNGFLSALKFVSQFMGRYDVSVNVYPSNRKEYNVISFLIGARERLAVEYKRKDFLNFGFLNNLRIKEDDRLHNVEENIKLIEKLSHQQISQIEKLEFNLLKEDYIFAERYFENINVNDSDLLIGFHPGCSTLKNHANRRWATEKFGRLAKILVEKHSAKIFVFGGKDEDELKNQVISISQSENVFSVSAENLAQTAAIMSRMKIFVTNDSSLMHVASALGLNVVSLIGPTNLNYIHPWKTNYKVSSLNLECSPCFYYSPKPLTCTRHDVKYKCIRELDIDNVYKNVLSLIS